MNNKTVKTNDMRKYLLGDMPDKEQIIFENTYFENEDIFDRLLAVEDDLIDDYLRNELPPGENERFQKHFLTLPGKKDKVEFAKTLSEVISIAPSTAVEPSAGKEPSGAPLLNAIRSFLLKPQPVFSFVALAAAMAGIWLFSMTFELQKTAESFHSQLQTEQDRTADLEKRITALTLADRPAPPTFTLLQASGLRAPKDKPDAPAFELSNNLSEVAFKLFVPDNMLFEEYSVEIRSQERKVWSERHFKAIDGDDGKIVMPCVNANIFSTRVYTVILEGRNEGEAFQLVSSYVFPVVRV